MRPFQPNGTLYPLSTGEGLRRAAVRGAGAAVGGQTANFVVGIVSVAVLARLLLPADFGIVTMVTTFSLLFCSFGLNGFVELIMQRDEITHGLASNIFWINLGIGLLLTVGFAGSGHLLAQLYHTKPVAQVTEGLSLTIGIRSLGYIHLGLLQRAMRFRAIAIINFIGQMIYVIACIALALAGFHYWALVWGAVVQAAVATAGIWAVCRWVPAWPKRVAGTASTCKFALHVFSHFVSNYSTSNTDNLLVGWRFGAQELGFYKKAYDLFILPGTQLMSPLNAVVVSTLSRINHDRDQFCRYFLRAISILALVGMGIGADFALVGQDLFRILLGPGWGEAGRIFALFGPGIGIMLLYNTHGWIHLSIGRPDRWFRWGLVECTATIGLFILGLRWGPSGIALAWTASFFLLILPAFWYAGRPIGLGIGPVLAVIWKFSAASAGAAILTLLIVRAMPHFAPGAGARDALVSMVSVSSIFFALYFGGVTALYRGAAPLRDSLSLLGDLLPSREARNGALRANETENGKGASAWDRAADPQKEVEIVSADIQSHA